MLSPPYTRQHVACNICGYFDLVSNMLPEIEQPCISGNMLLTSLAPPLRRAGGGAEESGDTATEFVAERNAIISSY